MSVFPYAAPYTSGCGFQVGVILEDGRPFIVGSFTCYELGLKYASEYALDLMRVPHARANRPLKLHEVRKLSDTELTVRMRFLRGPWADHMTRAQNHAQAALITRVRRERHPHPADLRGNYDPEAAQ